MRFYKIKLGENFPYVFKNLSNDQHFLEVDTKGMEETECPQELEGKFLGDVIVFYQENKPTDYISVLPTKVDGVYEASARLAEKVIQRGVMS